VVFDGRIAKHHITLGAQHFVPGEGGAVDHGARQDSHHVCHVWARKHLFANAAEPPSFEKITLLHSRRSHTNLDSNPCTLPTKPEMSKPIFAQRARCSS
jgi:hypothetical protein